MNRYILVRRLYGPAFLLLVGVNALLNQAHILSWSQSWPFYLILVGVLKLAERAALAADGYPQYVAPQVPGWQQPVSQPAAPAATPETPVATSTGTAVIPSIPVEIVKTHEGGQQ